MAVAIHAGAAANEFNVPQGGGRLPTIVLVECLAEEGSRGTGEYCRTTYQCSPTRDGAEISGTLWKGIMYHNGRLVTSGEEPIATERSCVLTVEDGAKVTDYHAYRPDGKEGESVISYYMDNGYHQRNWLNAAVRFWSD